MIKRSNEMNDRIKELAEQAKFMAEEDINKQISYNAELKAFAEKFAELIVRECARIVDEPYDFKTPANQRTYRYPLSGETVLEHFGVEE
jgi:plasmid stabilization system protein ParE